MPETRYCMAVLPIRPNFRQDICNPVNAMTLKTWLLAPTMLCAVIAIPSEQGHSESPDTCAAPVDPLFLAFSAVPDSGKSAQASRYWNHLADGGLSETGLWKFSGFIEGTTSAHVPPWWLEQLRASTTRQRSAAFPEQRIEDESTVTRKVVRSRMDTITTVAARRSDVSILLTYTADIGTAIFETYHLVRKMPGDAQAKMWSRRIALDLEMGRPPEGVADLAIAEHGNTVVLFGMRGEQVYFFVLDAGTGETLWGFATFDKGYSEEALFSEDELQEEISELSSGVEY